MTATELKQIGIDVDVNRVIEASRRSFDESENAILRRLLLGAPTPLVSSVIQSVTRLEVPQFGSRSRGHWQVKFDTEIVAGTSLKDAYCNMLLLAHHRDSQFLPRFSTYKARSRRYAARNSEGLYLSSPHLARKHAIELVPGWFVDGNLSEEQVGKRARAAAFASGLAYGTDVWIKESGRAI